MLPLSTITYRLLWAAFLGSVIGVERSARKRPAGMRTSLCVCVGAALFTILSSEIAKATGDSSATRIASNIVQGIGFLGAGVIMRERGSVVGLITAAAIFVEAAIGMGAGGGMYRVSGIAALIVLAALSGPGRVWLQTLPLANLAHALEPYLPHNRSETVRDLGAGAVLGGIVGSFLDNNR